MSEINVRDHGAKPDAPTSNANALKKAFNVAGAGDVIYFPEGYWELPDGTFSMGQGRKEVTIEGRNATVWSKGETRLYLKGLDDFNVLNISFKDVFLWIIENNGFGIRNARFEAVNNTEDIIRLAYCKDFTIVDVFGERHNNGRCVALAESSYGEVADVSFQGNLKTGINVSGNIDHNTDELIKIRDCKFERIATTHADEDHGAYFQTAKNIDMSDCFIKGWSNTTAGGSLKLRNSDNVTIDNNVFIDSGIILPSYPHCEPYPHLTNITIKDNFMDVYTGFKGTNAAIVFWRHLADMYPDGIREENIIIKDNIIRGHQPKFHLQTRYANGITTDLNHFINI